jgi:hypothetical protein
MAADGYAMLPPDLGTLPQDLISIVQFYFIFFFW